MKYRINKNMLWKNKSYRKGEVADFDEYSSTRLLAKGLISLREVHKPKVETKPKATPKPKAKKKTTKKAGKE